MKTKPQRAAQDGLEKRAERFLVVQGYFSPSNDQKVWAALKKDLENFARQESARAVRAFAKEAAGLFKNEGTWLIAEWQAHDRILKLAKHHTRGGK